MEKKKAEVQKYAIFFPKREKDSNMGCVTPT